jgi:hypothetical protein
MSPFSLLHEFESFTQILGELFLLVGIHNIVLVGVNPTFDDVDILQSILNVTMPSKSLSLYYTLTSKILPANSKVPERMKVNLVKVNVTSF